MASIIVRPYSWKEEDIIDDDEASAEQSTGSKADETSNISTSSSKDVNE